MAITATANHITRLGLCRIVVAGNCGNTIAPTGNERECVVIWSKRPSRANGEHHTLVIQYISGKMDAPQGFEP
ncbi:MAG: hypothetical protein HEQ21_00970 [Blastomonas sp.]|uniref:hypothetical protein n=1 Tax=Blastomonas sp. TaxID=1909299 RepID=UPI00258DDABD|nr:hypothetical protein [Blastomonas sp.]MCO5791368.1 hypothetical protein [Blastomonas sp.]